MEEHLSFKVRFESYARWSQSIALTDMLTTPPTDNTGDMSSEQAAMSSLVKLSSATWVLVPRSTALRMAGECHGEWGVTNQGDTSNMDAVAKFWWRYDNGYRQGRRCGHDNGEGICVSKWRGFINMSAWLHPFNRHSILQNHELFLQ